MRALSRVCWIFFGFSVALLASEIAARAILPKNAINRYEFDVDLGHVRPRSSAGLYKTAEFAVPVQYNSAGFRDVERSLKSLPGTFRIAVLGDSYVEGLQVLKEQTITAQLEERLKAGGVDRIEVLNFGVSGYGTAQEFLQLKKVVLQYEPRLVVLAFLSGNDVRNNSIILDQGTGDWEQAIRPYFELQGQSVLHHPPGKEAQAILTRSGWRYNLLDSSRLFSFFYGRFAREEFFARILRKIGVLNDGNFSLLNGIPTDYQLYRVPPTDVWRDAWRVTTYLLGQMNLELQERGIGFVLFLIPNREQVYPKIWSRIMERYPQMADGKNAWDLELPNKTLRAELVRSGIKIIDPLPSFRLEAERNPNQPLYFESDGHFTAAGQSLAAKLLEEGMETQIPLKR